MTAKQQLIDDKLVNLAQRCFKSSLVAHFLIRLYIRECMETCFVKGFACDTTHPVSKLKLFPKGYGAEPQRKELSQEETCITTQ